MAVVCLGNICRSPIAHVVLADKLTAVPTLRPVIVESFGTGDWHIGEPMDPRAAQTLTAAGYDSSRHRARHTDRDLIAGHDVVLVMDATNLRDVRALASTSDDRDRVMLFREFDPLAGDDLDVPDPWYGGQGGFDEVLAIVERTTDVLAALLSSR